MKYTLQQNVWQGSEAIEIELPDDWDVEYHGIKADEMPPLSRETIRERINTPYGLPPLRELAKGKQRVCVVFDDISRATPTQILAEIVLEELHEAGITPEQIRFICALGTHGAHDRNDFVCKLGEHIVKNYRVYNHNCYDNCVCIGKTKRGFDVCINAEFMSCDLKIGLGAILPHVYNTFGGGSKLLFPGIASIDTIQSNHTAALDFAQAHDIIPAETMGDMRVNGMRSEVEEMARMVGEFFKVDCLYNTRHEIVDLYAGDPIEEYYAAIPAAQRLYVTPRAKDKQIVIANANARANEATIAMTVGLIGVSPKGGDLVVINHTKRGQVTHYLLGTFGDNAPGRMFGQSKKTKEGLERVICYMPYAMKSDVSFYGKKELQVYVDTWEEALALLREKYGPGTKVSILADATMQYYEVDENASYIK